MNQPAASHSPGHTVCTNPANGKVIGHSAVTPVDEMPAIISRARAAQQSWSRQSIAQRVKHILRLRDYIVQHMDEIAYVIAEDNGKTRVDALATDVMTAALGVDYYARHAARFLKDRCLMPGNILLANKISKIVRVPYGVVGIISPWNYPFSIPFAEVVMALLAGNTVVLKTATQTQMVGRKLEECLAAAQLPPAVFNYVNLPGPLAGDAMLQNGIDKIFFTGSVAAGRTMMQAASRTLTPLVLELGGNDAMLVCPDADLHRAAAGAVWAGFSNCGQSCAGVERIYVHEAVYDAFLERLKQMVSRLRVGVGEDFDIDLGVMTTQRQIEIVGRHIDDALAKGAVVYARSPQPADADTGQILPAVVLTGVDHSMLVMQEETFGPVLAVMKVKDMDTAVDLANDSIYGLTGSVWSRNRRLAEQIGRRIQAGVITINDHLMSHGLAETPWGGFKNSGIGRTHGAIGFDEMTQPQVIVHDWLPFARQNMWWQPYSQKIYKGLAGCVDLLYGASFKQRLQGLWQVIKIIPRYFTTR